MTTRPTSEECRYNAILWLDPKVCEEVYEDILHQIRQDQQSTDNMILTVQRHDYAISQARHNHTTHIQKLCFVFYACCHYDMIMDHVRAQTDAFVYNMVFEPPDRVSASGATTRIDGVYEDARATMCGRKESSYAVPRFITEYIARLGMCCAYHQVSVPVSDHGHNSHVRIPSATGINPYTTKII